MPRALAISVCLAMLAAFCDAPLAHFHQHENAEHARSVHQGGGLAEHTHAISPESSAPGWHAAGNGDDDAVFLTWAPTAPQSMHVTVALQPGAPVPTFAAVVAGFVMLPSPRSHDPPQLRSTSPRSPPHV